MSKHKKGKNKKIKGNNNQVKAVVKNNHTLKFFMKASILLLPFALLISFPLYVHVKSGELKSVDSVIDTFLNAASKEYPETGTSTATTSNEFLYGPAYVNQNVYIKLKLTNALKPDILALGNSKILGIRDTWFESGVKFFNAGATIPSVDKFSYFMNQVETLPKVLIITVEPIHFAPEYELPSDAERNKVLTQSNPLTEKFGMFSANWIKTYKDYLSDKYTVTDLQQSATDVNRSNLPIRIGLNAAVNQAGVRSDGSYTYGKQSGTIPERRMRITDTVLFIDHFESQTDKTEFSEAALGELDSFLAWCEEKGIYVIGFIPPMPHAVYDAYARNPEFSYLFETFNKTEPVFKKHNFNLYDYFDMQATLGATDDEAVDGYHVGELVSEKMFKSIGDKEPLLRAKK